jgi:hypothetical protein
MAAFDGASVTDHSRGLRWWSVDHNPGDLQPFLVQRPHFDNGRIERVISERIESEKIAATPPSATNAGVLAENSGPIPLGTPPVLPSRRLALST